MEYGLRVVGVGARGPNLRLSSPRNRGSRKSLERIAMSGFPFPWKRRLRLRACMFAVVRFAEKMVFPVG